MIRTSDNPVTTTAVTEMAALPPLSSKSEQLSALTGLRFALALWVIIFHQTEPEGYFGLLLPNVPDLAFCLLRTGYVAVSVFFALSGFVLSYSHASGLAQPWTMRDVKQFLLLRFARIYPGYLVGLVLVVPTVVFGYFKPHSTFNILIESTTALLNVTLLQSWVPSLAVAWNGPAWSLSDEAFFYLCFPWIAIALWRCVRIGSTAACVIALWSCSLIVPVYTVVAPIHGLGDAPATSFHLSAAPAWQNFVKYTPLLHLPDFCLGIIGAKLFLRLVRDKSALLGRGYWLYLPAIAVELLVIGTGKWLPYPLMHNGLLLPVHIVLIVGFALGGGWITRFLSRPWMVLLGAASYAMYIIHLPLSVWINFGVRAFSGRNPQGTLFGTGYIVAVIILSVLIFKCYEEPVNRYLRKVFKSKNRVPAA